MDLVFPNRTAATVLLTESLEILFIRFSLMLLLNFIPGENVQQRHSKLVNTDPIVLSIRGAAADVKLAAWN